VLAPRKEHVLPTLGSDDPGDNTVYVAEGGLSPVESDQSAWDALSILCDSHEEHDELDGTNALRDNPLSPQSDNGTALAEFVRERLADRDARMSMAVRAEICSPADILEALAWMQRPRARALGEPIYAAVCRALVMAAPRHPSTKGDGREQCLQAFSLDGRETESAMYMADRAPLYYGRSNEWALICTQVEGSQYHLSPPQFARHLAECAWTHDSEPPSMAILPRDSNWQATRAMRDVILQAIIDYQSPSLVTVAEATR
jgi:hypothetical protein